MRGFREYLALSDLVQIAILVVLTVTAIFIYSQAAILRRNYGFEIIRDLRDDTSAMHQELFAPNSLYERLRAGPCDTAGPDPVEIRFLTRSIFDHYRLYQTAARQSMITETEWHEACRVGRALIRENCALERFWASDMAPADDPEFTEEFNAC